MKRAEHLAARSLQTQGRHNEDFVLALRVLCRIQYAKLWRSLILADVDGIKSASIAMNAGDSYQLFAGMLTNRPWEKVSYPLHAARTLVRISEHIIVDRKPSMERTVAALLQQQSYPLHTLPWFRRSCRHGPRVQYACSDY